MARIPGYRIGDFFVPATGAAIRDTAEYEAVRGILEQVLGGVDNPASCARCGSIGGKHLGWVEYYGAVTNHSRGTTRDFRLVLCPICQPVGERAMRVLRRMIEGTPEGQVRG